VFDKLIHERGLSGFFNNLEAILAIFLAGSIPNMGILDFLKINQ